MELTRLETENLVTEVDADNTAIAGRMRDLIASAEPPADVESQVQYVLDAVRKAADGNRQLYDSPQMQADTSEIDAWVHTSCGYPQIDVVYRDYGYEGIPARIASGPTSFRATQAGKEPHVMQIYRLREGVEGSPEELLAEARRAPIPSQALARMTELVAVGAFVDFDGTAAHLTVDLSPGSYLVICPIPTGIGPDRVPPADAVPHFDRGMAAGFVVE